MCTTMLIALQSTQSLAPKDEPCQQRRDDPKRRDGPAAAACLGLVDFGNGLRRQHQTVARDFVELIEQTGAARKQPRRVADKTSDLGDTCRRIFEFAGGAEIS